MKRRSHAFAIIAVAVFCLSGVHAYSKTQNFSEMRTLIGKHIDCAIISGKDTFSDTYIVSRKGLTSTSKEAGTEPRFLLFTDISTIIIRAADGHRMTMVKKNLHSYAGFFRLIGSKNGLILYDLGPGEDRANIYNYYNFSYLSYGEDMQRLTKTIEPKKITHAAIRMIKERLGIELNVDAPPEEVFKLFNL